MQASDFGSVPMVLLMMVTGLSQIMCARREADLNCVLAGTCFMTLNRSPFQLQR